MAKDKRSASVSHARKRAAQRYGVVLDKADIEAVNRLIRSGRAKFLYRESCTRTHFELPNGARVVYNRKAKTVCTFLPPAGDCKAVVNWR